MEKLLTRTQAQAAQRASRAHWAHTAWRGPSLFPLRMTVGYLVATFVLFLVWPINWTIYDPEIWPILLVYISGCYGLVYLAGSLAMRVRAHPGWSIHPPLLIATGAMLAMALLTPLSFAYTGHGPWDVMTAFGDQGVAYDEVQELIARSSGTSRIVLFGAIAAPLIFAAQVLGVLYWSQLGPASRVLTMGAILTMLVLSVLKGTDREIANLVILLVGTLSIAAARKDPGGSILASLVRHHRAALLILAVIASIASLLYIERRVDRLGGTNSVCAMGTGICADLNSPLTAWMGERVNFGTSSFVLSVTQGYYGVAVAMGKPFDSTYGLGHSPALLSYADRAFGQSFSNRAYTTKIAVEDGWSDRNFWASAITWWANDVGFAGALMVLGLFGYLFGATWRDAVLANNDAAAVLFILTLSILIYTPLNNQMFLVIDTYFTFIVWLGVWLASTTLFAKARRV